MAATDARPVPLKNTAYRIYFPILDADGDLVTGATGLDSEVSLDGGTFADCTNEATEVATSSGVYYLDLTAAEMNTDCSVVIVKTSSSGAKTTVLTLYPEEAGDINVDVTAWLGTAAKTPSTAGVPEVRLTDAMSHGGTTAQLRLGSSTSTAALWVTSSGGQAAVISSSHANASSCALGVFTTGTGPALWVETYGGGTPAIIGNDGGSRVLVGSGGSALTLEAYGSGNFCIEAIAGSSATDSNLAVDLNTDAVSAAALATDAVSEITTAISAAGDATILQSTTIATLASQTSFTLTAGSADNDAYNNRVIIFEDASTSVQKAVGIVSDYVGATRTVTLSAAPAFTVATGDTVRVLAVGDQADAIIALINPARIVANTGLTAENKTIYADADYSSSDTGRPLSWSIADADLTAGAVAFYYMLTSAYEAGTGSWTSLGTGTVSAYSSGLNTVKVSLTAAQVATLTIVSPPADKFSYTYKVEVTLSGRVRRSVLGGLNVVR